jgi:hypothetical protein
MRAAVPILSILLNLSERIGTRYADIDTDNYIGISATRMGPMRRTVRYYRKD